MNYYMEYKFLMDSVKVGDGITDNINVICKKGHWEIQNFKFVQGKMITLLGRKVARV